MRTVVSVTWWALAGGCLVDAGRGTPSPGPHALATTSSSGPEASPTRPDPTAGLEPAGRPALPDTRLPRPPALCVNEISPANRVSARDEAGLASDWIELHNPGDADVSLEGWSIGDDPDPAEAWPLPARLVVPARGDLVLWADDAPERGPTHLPFALDAAGELVALFAPDRSASVVHFGPTSGDLVLEREEDCCYDPGGSCLRFTFAGTPGASNHPTAPR